MLKKIVLIVTAFFALLPFSNLAFAQQGAAKSEFNGYYNKAMESYHVKNYQQCIENFIKALQIEPSHTGAKYNLACAYALNGNKTESVALLNELLDKGQGLDAENDGDFNSIRESAEFKLILEKIKKAKTPILNSTRAFVVKEKDLIPEGLTYDSESRSFFLSSIYKAKIVSSDKKGKAQDFTSEGQDGLWAVIGMKADSERGILWANSSAGSHTKGYKDSDIGRAGVFKYDLKSRKLIKKYLAEDTLYNHFFNDLALASNGDVYLTDSESPAVYKVNNATDKLELFLHLQNYIYPNGIAMSDDNKHLYVAHSSGVVVINVQDKTLKDITHPDNVSLNYIDGLYFYKNSLIGIQNFGFNRIARFYLNEKLDEVKKIKVIEAYNPDFIIPTTGVIVGNEFYYIANSQLASFDQQGKILPEEKLKDIVILKAKL